MYEHSGQSEAAFISMRWLVVGLLLAVSVVPIAGVDASQAQWLKQVCFELGLAALAIAAMGRVSLAVAFEKLGWCRGDLSRSRQLFLVGICLLASASFAILSNSESRAVTENLAAQQSVHLAALLMSLVILPAFCEELLFRGALQRILTNRMGAGLAILTASLLFGVLHASGGLRAIAFSITLGLCLGVVTQISGSIREAMWIHGLNNMAYFMTELA